MGTIGMAMGVLGMIFGMSAMFRVQALEKKFQEALPTDPGEQPSDQT